ncbi:hypothetical protein OJ253_1631 [Cryptosporidium canis]|uniref:Hpc2-related domain-containing protein n=1 Tax=Cryptosporidium canis TaxID=195482 RepID=A0A9D5DIY2_9CRYT|nr:hypothetical protein OJ253_1631 [Cryptosporidium canis]
MTPTSPKPSDSSELHKPQIDQEYKRERNKDPPKNGQFQEDDTSVVDDYDYDSSDYESLIDSFRFERGLSLLMDIPKETIKYIYSDRLDKHVQLPSIVSFRDLCIEAFGEDNVIEKKSSDTGKRKWDNILKKSLTHESQEQDDTKEDENKDNEERENEDSERTYEDITSFLDTIKSNNKQDMQNVSENALRKRVHEMSTRLSKQGLLCDPRDYYFNPMTMTGANGANRSREDYYDVFDDFIDDSELVDDLGLSLDELYNRNVERGSQSNGMGDDIVTTTSIQTSELIYAEYSNPSVFYCDDDPENDHVDLYYESGSGDENDEEDDDVGFLDSDQDEFGTKTDGSDSPPKKSGLSLRDVLNNPVIKLLVQLRTDCWVYYSPKNLQSSKDQNLECSNQGSSNAPTSSTPMIDLSVGLPSSQNTVDLTTPTAKSTKEVISTTYYFPQRTPRLVSDWFRALNKKLQEIIEAYNRCKSYYSENGNVKCESCRLDADIANYIKVLTSSIEKDPIILRIPSLFSDIYSDPADVAPFDSKLIRIIWDGLNMCVPINNKKRQFNLSHNSSESSAIIQLLTKFENFRTKWARLILNHNQEALYQFDLNAFEAITNYPPIKNKSPDYVQKVLNSINEYNLKISGSCAKEKEERSDSKVDYSGDGSNTPILATYNSHADEVNMENVNMDSLDISHTQNDTTCEHNFEPSGSLTKPDLIGDMENYEKQESPNGEILEKPKSAKDNELGSQGIKAVSCELVLDFGISLLEYIHGINRLRIVYKDMISSNVITKSVQKEQENIPVNGSRGLELMIKEHILKRFSNVSFEGQKIKDIPHRFFLNQIKLLQIKYSYKSLTTISARKPKTEPEPKTTKKRQRKETVKADSEQASKSPTENEGTGSVSKPKKPRKSNKSTASDEKDALCTDGDSNSLKNKEVLLQSEKPLDGNVQPAEKKKQVIRKNKGVTIDDHITAVVNSGELAENSQSSPLETPRLDLNGHESSAVSKPVTDTQIDQPTAQETRIVERELYDPERMVSHTIQDDTQIGDY